MKCETCDRDRVLNFHHLIPRTLHSNKWFQKRYSGKEMDTRGMHLCNDCHKTIHKFYPAKQLGKEFNTVETILSDEKLSKTFKFFSKQK